MSRWRNAVVSLLLVPVLHAGVQEKARPPEEDRAEAIAWAVSELSTLEGYLDRNPGDAESRLQRVRLLYFLSIDEERYVERSSRAIHATLKLPGEYHPDPHALVSLAGYAAALEVMRGKHASWPPYRLSHVRRGLERLDEEVERHPDHAELRYLRLVNGFYLPGIFGRGSQVKEDLHRLERRLPEVVDRYPPSTFAAMAAFVLERGASGETLQEPLRRALRESRQDRLPGPAAPGAGAPAGAREPAGTPDG